MAALFRLRRFLPSVLARVLQDSRVHVAPSPSERCWTPLGSGFATLTGRALLHQIAAVHGSNIIHLEPLRAQVRTSRWTSRNAGAMSERLSRGPARVQADHENRQKWLSLSSFF
jgi:hypothetical protein